jgi:hypothetical protein
MTTPEHMAAPGHTPAGGASPGHAPVGGAGTGRPAAGSTVSGSTGPTHVTSGASGPAHAPAGATGPAHSAPQHADPAHDEYEEEQSLGQLVAEIGADVSKLFRQEVELAKAEIRQEAAKAGKAAGMLGGAGFAGYMVAVLLTLAVMFGLGNVMNLGWAALIVAVLWAVAGAVLFVSGRNRMRQVRPKPEQTIETLKEDAQWARDLRK